jgi:hypothetical protein
MVVIFSGDRARGRDVVAGGERLLDQFRAGGAGGPEDGEVHGSAPYQRSLAISHPR